MEILSFFALLYAALFAFGGFWLIGALVLFILIESALIHTDRYGFATIALAGLIGFIAYFVPAPDGQTWFSFFSIASLITYAVIYFFIGVLWSFGKYASFVSKEKKYFEKYTATNYEKGSDEYESERERLKKRTAISYNMSRYYSWTVFWPFSFIAWALGDMLANIGKYIWKGVKAVADQLYKALGGVYSSIRKRILGDLAD